MPNSFAYVVLFSWPLVVFLLFRFLPRTQALVWSIIGGYLALPFGVGINPPVLPTFDKTLIPALSAVVMCLSGIAPFAVPPRRSTPAGPGRATVAPQTNAGPAFTRQKTRLPGRTAAQPGLADQIRQHRTPLVIPLLGALLFATQGLTFLLNTAPAQVGVVMLPGLRPYDAFSMVLNTGVMLLPFGLGWRYLGQIEAQAILLRVLCLAALIYSLPTLFEIRMSPQLARWTYGFLAQSFEQALREGGFRPVVFLQHGLWLALFMATAALSCLALWRQRGRAGGWGFGLWAALWLTLVLFLSKSLGAFALLLVLSPVILLVSVRGQLLVAAVLAAIVLSYPMLRGSGLVPVETLYSLAASVSEERAGSLKFRLDNEDILLAHANEKPLAGWGGFSRSRVFNPETGQDLSVTDGAWVIVMGVSGWLGYLGTFGLLTMPVILLFLRARGLGLSYVTAGLCLIMSANLVDMIANATLTPVTWLIAGSLAGRCRFSLVPPQADREQNPRARPGPKPARLPPQRRTIPRLRQVVLVMALLVALPGTPARAGLSSPTLSFGLTGVSDWSTQMAFLDLMKSSRPWIGHAGDIWSAMTADELVAGGYLDADGWPMEIPQGLTSVGTIWAWAGSAVDPTAAASRAGVYVLTYEGEGTLQLQGVTILSSEPGRLVVQNLTGGEMLLNITATDPGQTGNYLRTITLVRQEYEALHAAGQVFNPDWLSVVEDARELRFKDWMSVDWVTSANWEDRPQVSDVSWTGGVPVEVMVALANQTGTEPWFTMPAGADEAYIRSFATYVRDHLDAGLEVHVEYSNELWNWAYGQTQWLGAQAATVWGSSDGAAWLDYAAMLATRAALIWDDVFGAGADQRVDNVLGTQTANAWIANRLLTAPLWQAMDPSGYVAPSSVFDSLAVTTYFGGATMANADLRAEFLAVLKTPGVDATAWLAAKLMDPDYDQSIPQVLGWWAANKAVADQYGIDLVAYEGGQHVLHSFAVAGLTEADLATLTTFLSGFVRSQAMAELYHELWTAWAAVSDGPFMQFGDVAAASKYGAWGLLSALGDQNPRADLLMDLNANSTAWFGSGGGAQYEQGLIKVAGDAGEVLIGTDRDDFLIGGEGDDEILAGLGHDAIAGEGGHDTLVLSGTPSDYTIITEANGYRLTATGISHYIRGIEAFKFEGQVTISLADMLRITVAAGKPLIATNGRDALVGGHGADTVDAKLGNDSIFGRGGADTVLGDSGADLLFGGGGDDMLDGGIGVDTLVGGDGDDTFVVSTLADVIIERGGAGVDLVLSATSWTLGAGLEHLILSDAARANGTGNAQDNLIRVTSTLSETGGANRLSGLDGQDSLMGGGGADTLDGGTGDDRMLGGFGDDSYFVDTVDDLVIERADQGTDVVFSTINWGLGALVENLILIGTEAVNGTGNAAANKLVGNGAANRLNGNAGVDTILGGAGDDTLDGGAEADLMIGGLGDDLYLVDDAADRANEATAAGVDTVRATVSFDLAANIENLTLAGFEALSGTGNALANMLTANSAANLLFGRSGGDTLLGGGGADTLDGGKGGDVMAGGSGDDLYVVDNVGDRISDLSDVGTDTVQSLISYALAPVLENLILTGAAAINGTGNTRANSLTGNAAANGLEGGAGADTLAGRGGNDTLTGGNGADQFVFTSTASGADVITDFNARDGDVLRIDGLLTGSFAYLGTADFSGGSDNSEARIVGNRVLIDTNGDGTADITLTLTGLAGPGQLTAGDFVFL